MPLTKKLENFLKKHKIKYQILNHKTVYTAFDKSQTLKVSPKKVVKTLILKIDKNLAFVLIPGDKKLDLRKVKKLGKNVSLATEKLLQRKLKGTKVGAVPPFGSLWKLQTFGDKLLKKQKEIIVNGGDWQTSLLISPKELEKIENFSWGSFSK